MDAFKYIKNKTKRFHSRVFLFCFQRGLLRTSGGLGQLSPTVGLSLRVVGLKAPAGFHPGWGTHLELNK